MSTGTPPIPDCIEREVGSAPNAAVIWLHGLGADASDFVPVVPLLGLEGGPAIRFVFPNAPVRPVTINGGMRMRAWYDILELGGRRHDAAGIRASQAVLDALVEREVRRGIAHERIVVAGFSQGGAIALHAGLRHPHPLGGILALSTYLPLAESLADEAAPGNRDIPIFMAHGRDDAMIPLDAARRSHDAMVAAGYRVEWAEYAMGHEVCPDEIAAIGGWLARRFG